jgi:hypothetical protein
LRASPWPRDAMYRLVARHRALVGKAVSTRARNRADAIVRSASVTTSQQLAEFRPD